MYLFYSYGVEFIKNNVSIKSFHYNYTPYPHVFQYETNIVPISSTIFFDLDFITKDTIA